MKQKTYSSLDEYFKIRYITGILYPPILYVFIQMLVQVVGNWYYSIQYVKNKDSVTAAASMYMVEEVQQFVQQHVYIMNIWSALLGCIVFLVIYQKDCKEKQKPFLYKQIRDIKTYRIGFPVLFACMGNLGLSRLVSLLPAGESIQQYEETSNLLMSGSLIVQFLCIAIFVPVVEEVIYRGLVYNRAKRYLSNGQAIIFSALMFAVFHFNLVQGIYAFIMGVIFAYVYSKYDNLIYSILMHSVANGVAVLVNYFAVSKFINQHIFIYLVVMLLELGVAGYCVYELYKDDNK